MYSSVTLVLSREDQFGEHRGLGISVVKFKVTSPDENGILILKIHSNLPSGESITSPLNSVAVKTTTYQSLPLNLGNISNPHSFGFLNGQS